MTIKELEKEAQYFARKYNELSTEEHYITGLDIVNLAKRFAAETVERIGIEDYKTEKGFGKESKMIDQVYYHVWQSVEDQKQAILKELK